MSIHADSERGTYEVRVEYKNPFTLERVQVHKRGFPTIEKARLFESQVYLEKNKKNRKPVTCEELFPAFMKYKATKSKAQTLSGYESILNAYVLPYFGKTKINKISVPDIQHWQNLLLYEISKRGIYLKSSSLRQIQQAFSQFFKYSIAIGLRETNPLSILGYVKRIDEAVPEMLFLTYEQYLNFRSVITNKDHLLIFDTLYFTGMRISELQARTWEHFNYATQSLNITTNYDNKNKIITPTTKNKINRNIILTTGISNRLHERYLENRDFKNFKESCYIFGFDDVLPYHKVCIAKKEYLEKWNSLHPDEPLPPIRLHDIRHSTVSLLINNGLGSFEIAQFIGDKQSTVERTYAHLFPEKKKKISNILERFDTI